MQTSCMWTTWKVVASNHLVDSEWLTITPATRKEVKIEDVSLFIPNKNELAKIFEACGRPNDFLNAELLRKMS